MARRRNDGVLTAPADPFSPAPAGSTADELRPDDPRQIGSYILLSRLGPSAVGPVYLGRSPGGRSVRVQVVDPGLARDPAFRLRFARDVEAASRVGGAFTAPVIDTDPDAPLPWLVTGFVPGPSLAEVVGRYGPLPVPSALALAAALATGLRAVHAAGLAHGGLDPASVLLAPDGPRLTGFGLSQAAGYARLVAGAGAGAPGFTPPEQVPGTPAGPAGDIFALGAVLAFAAAGQWPSVTGDALGRVPGQLRAPIEWCQAGNPARRPTAGQFLAALTAAHPEAATPAGWRPVGILSQTAPPTLDFPVVRSSRPARQPRAVPVVSPATAAPPVMAAPPVPRLRVPGRKRAWLTAAVAVVAVAGAAAGLLAAWPRSSLGPPARQAATVASPPLADAVFPWSGMVTYRETSGTDTDFKAVGTSWQEDWSITSDCGWQVCRTATLDGYLDNESFTAHLTRSGADYRGTAAIDNDWLDCVHQTDFRPSKLSIKLTVTSAGRVYQQHWNVTAFSGAVTWDVPVLPDGCPGSSYAANVSGLESVAGVNSP